MKKTLFILSSLFIHLVTFSQIGYGYQNNRGSGINLNFNQDAFKSNRKERVDVVIKSEKEEKVSKLELMKLKIQNVMQTEIPKYNLGAEPSFWYLEIININEENDRYLVDGEFTYWPKYPQTKTLKFKAEIKPMLDDFSVIRITYYLNNEWYRLFPANDF